MASWLYPHRKNIIFFVGFVVATECAWRLYKKYENSKKRKQKINMDKPISEVLFFSEQAATCRIHASFNTPCTLASCPIVNLNKLVSYISSATRNLDVCVYFLTCNCIVKAIIELENKGVFVRVITDDESSGNEASQVFNMRKAGIKVRSRKSLYLMHHKFVIVDRKLLISGSANWTVQAFFGNYENILVTNHHDIVRQYLHEFEKLWLKFDSDYIHDLDAEKTAQIFPKI